LRAERQRASSNCWQRFSNGNPPPSASASASKNSAPPGLFKDPSRSWPDSGSSHCCQALGIKYQENRLTTVIPRPNEPVEVALRRFRRSITNLGLLKELRARTAYESPTAARKRKKAAAVARLRKQIRRSLPPKKLY
jgi:small subunit ribosomal protein S21